ncbi:MAG: integrase [Acidimicrobiales bacterium]|nr:integrase [Acidimicrobiales bacterium]
MSAVAARAADGPARHRDWDLVVAHTPQLAVTAWRYLDQLAVSMRPATVDVADNTLRCFARFIVDNHPELAGFVDVRRPHVEAFKLFFVAHITAAGKPPARNTIRQRFGMLRTFFDRIIEWDWDDAPMRIPIFSIDVPVADDPLPRFLDDVQAARLAAAAAAAAPFDRLVIEVLSRTGMRVGELCDLAGDAVFVLDGEPWLRVPVGKLHNDRNIPLHPNAARLIAEWTLEHPPAGSRLIHVDGEPLDRHHVSRIVRRVAAAAGLGHVHPHQLRHTLATQAINRGMRLESIATMLGHRSLRMTLTYAKIANKTVADEYASASAKIDALYTSTDPEQRLEQLAAEHRRMLANGWCNRPIATDCIYETICEGCGYYQTTIEFRPTLKAQAEHAERNHQTERAAIYNRLLDTLSADTG